MKKLLSIVALTLISFSGFSQIGFKLGAVSVTPKASISGISVNAKASTGLQAGIYYVSQVSENFSIQPEVNFVYCANKADDYKMSFIFVPVLGMLTVAEKFKFGAGPQLDYLLSFTSEGKSALDGMKKIGFSGLLSGQYQINEKFAIGVRYSIPVVGYKYDATLVSGNLKNSVLGLFLVTGF